MNTIYMSQQLNARMQFKSLLLLTLLAGSASAQQSTMPPIALEIPTIPAFQAPEADGVLPSLDGATAAHNFSAQASADGSRSTWTLRQHATWLLGLKPRQMHNTVEPSLAEVPCVDIVSLVEIQPTTADMPTLPDMPTDTVLPDTILLVQHNEPVAPIDVPTLTAPAEVITASGQVSETAAPVAHAHPSAPHSLNLRPVISGPAPKLPLEQSATESLLQVDVSGIDPARVVGAQTASESLIDSFDFRPPTGFSMRDNDTATLEASPSRAKPVSIHEGFAPRVSSANQAAQLDSAQSGPSSSDRLTVSLPGVSKFSMSDKPSSAVGPIQNRLSDKEPVHERLADKDEPSKAVEKSFSDRDSLLASVPVEVSTSADKTSRSSKPEVLTPPSRLSKDSPLALPLSSATPIASTGIEAELPIRKTATVDAKLAEPKKPLGSDKVLAKTAPVASQPESLIDGLVPSPSLLTSEQPAPPKMLAAVVTAAPTTNASATNPPAVATTPLGTSKVDKPKQAEKFSLSDTNPIAMKRPVVKAANVAIPDTASPDSTVVQSSHEMDDAGQQTAEYAKMAAKMQQAIKQKFPNCRVKITCNEDGLIAEGHVANNTEASKLLTFVRKTSLCPVADRVTASQ